MADSHRILLTGDALAEYVASVQAEFGDLDYATIVKTFTADELKSPQSPQLPQTAQARHAFVARTGMVPNAVLLGRAERKNIEVFYAPHMRPNKEGEAVATDPEYEGLRVIWLDAPTHVSVALT